MNIIFKHHYMLIANYIYE